MHYRWFISLFLFLLVANNVSPYQTASTNYQQDVVIDSSGGGNTSSSNFATILAISQRAIGATSSTNYIASLGFFYSGITSLTQNDVPAITVPTISPSDPNTSSNLACYATPSDTENTTLTVEFQWYNYTGSAFEFVSGGNNTGLSNGSNQLITTLTSDNTFKGETWNCSVRSYDGSLYSDWKSVTKNINNALPSINLSSPTEENTSIHDLTPTFYWTAADADSDAMNFTLWVDDNSDFSSPIIEAQSNDQNHTSSTELAVDTQYFWRVQAYDQTAYVNSSDWNFTTESLIAITLIQDSVDFGSVIVNKEYNTTDDSPAPLMVRNDGNVYVNLTIYAKNSFFNKTTLNTSSFRFRADNRTETGSINSTLSQITFINMTDASVDLAKIMDWHDTSDVADIDLSITVPQYESPGAKVSIIEISAS